MLLFWAFSDIKPACTAAFRRSYKETSTETAKTDPSGNKPSVHVRLLGDSTVATSPVENVNQPMYLLFSTTPSSTHSQYGTHSAS